jgi:DNA-binding transcriptional MerR regulator
MYTVKEICHFAGATPRTLHYYDEIGLLKPSQIGDNGYRYYGEEAVLRLQQILLYRKMDMPLEVIKSILDRKDFEIQTALQEHRKILLQRIAQMELIVATVDETLLYLKGEKRMETRQFFAGFSDEEQAKYEQEATKMYDPEAVKASNLKWKKAPQQEREAALAEFREIALALAAAMPQGADSPAVQALVERWRRSIEYFWVPDLDQLLGLAELYNEDPRFKANYDSVDPHLAEFLREAIHIYVERAKSKFEKGSAV